MSEREGQWLRRIPGVPDRCEPEQPRPERAEPSDVEILSAEQVERPPLEAEVARLREALEWIAYSGELVAVRAHARAALSPNEEEK